MTKLVKPAKVTFLSSLSNAKDMIFGHADDVARDLAKAIAAGYVAKVLSYRPPRSRRRQNPG